MRCSAGAPAIDARPGRRPGKILSVTFLSTERRVKQEMHQQIRHNQHSMLFDKNFCARTLELETLFEYLKRLELPAGDYAVFGSGPLIVRGIVSPTNDLDVVCRRAVWETVRKIGTLQFSDEYGVEIVALFDGRVTFGNKWGSGDFDIDDLIDHAELIDGLPFVRLEHVVAYKKKRGTAKDRRNIELLARSNLRVGARSGA